MSNLPERSRGVVVAEPLQSVENLEPREAVGLSLAQIFHIVRAHLKLASLIAIAIVGLTTAVTKLLPKTYSATATMIVSFQVSQGGQEIPAFLLSTYMATQIELMHSPEVLLPVVDHLDLIHDPEFVAGSRATDTTALRNYAASTLDKHLIAEQGRGSQLLYLTATSRSAVKAALIANTVAETYENQEHERLKGPANLRARDYSQELAELRAKVMAAQQKVTDLRQQTGTAPVSSEHLNATNDADTQTLVNLEQQLLQAQNVRRAAESETNMAPVGSAGNGAGSPEIQALKAEIVAKELQLSQLSPVYGPHHPKVLELQSDLSKARENLQRETQKYLSDARQMELKLQQAVDAQRQKIVSVRKLQDQGAKLELELESAESVYKRALDGYDQIVFASSGNSSNVSFVSRAAVPSEATKPNKIKFLLGGLVMGILVGIAAPVFYELLFDRRLHCRDDLERHFGIPVLAVFGAESIQPVTAAK